jgi:hypothetical protein
MCSVVRQGEVGKERAGIRSLSTMPSSRRSKEVRDDDNSIGGRICTYQQAHIIEKSVSLWRGYQSVKKYILVCRDTHHLAPRASCRSWATGRPRNLPARAMRPSRDHQAHKTPFVHLVNNQICVVRREELVNNLECHAKRGNSPIHALHAVGSRATNEVLWLCLRTEYMPRSMRRTARNAYTSL